MGDPHRRRRRCGHHRRHRSAGRADHRAPRSDYLTIVTLGFSESVRIAATNEIWLTNGSEGIAGIPRPRARHRLATGVRRTLPGHRPGGARSDIRPAAAPVSCAVWPGAARAIRDDEEVAGKHLLAFKVPAVVAQSLTQKVVAMGVGG
jgi:branched-chain amino acid transport system permease protein